MARIRHDELQGGYVKVWLTGPEQGAVLHLSTGNLRSIPDEAHSIIREHLLAAGLVIRDADGVIRHPVEEP